MNLTSYSDQFGPNKSNYDAFTTYQTKKWTASKNSDGNEVVAQKHGYISENIKLMLYIIVGWLAS